MSAILHSPFTIGLCLLLLFAWVMMFWALFWPQHGPINRDDIDAHF